jgi:two-component system, NarL family, response regulator DevR
MTIPPPIEAGPRRRLRVLLLEDQDALRIGLRTVLSDAGLEVVATCRDCATARRLLPSTRPDVVVLELRLPSLGCDGLQFCREVTSAPGAVPVVVFTGCADPMTAERARAAGASAYVVKRASVQSMVDVVRSVAAGQPPRSFMIDPGQVLDRDLRRLLEARLTSREAEVLVLVIDGHSNRQVADRLDLAEATIKNVLHGAMAKLGFRSRTQAVAFGTRLRVRTGADDGWT